MDWLDKFLNKVTKESKNEFIEHVDVLKSADNFGDENQVDPQLIEDIKSSFSNLFNDTIFKGSYLNTKPAKGVIFFKSDDYSTTDYQNLIDFIRAQLLSYYYKNSVAHRTYKESVDEKHCLEMLYMKPPRPTSFENQYDQQFGQVLVEHKIQNGETVSFKILCTYYSGRKYTEPYSFDNFMESVFGD